MKQIYQKPEMKTVVLHTAYKLMAGSDISLGTTYTSGSKVLSRDGGAIWDDDEE